MASIREITSMIHDCKQRESKLTEWEVNFITSLSEQLDSNDTFALTLKQQEKLDAIWERVTATSTILSRR